MTIRHVDRRLAALVVGCAVALAATTGVLAQGPPPPAGEARPPLADPRDFSGTWRPALKVRGLPGGKEAAAPTGPLEFDYGSNGQVLDDTFTTGLPATTGGEQPPFRPEALAYAQHRRRMDQQGTPIADLGVLCRPDMPTNLMNLALGGFEIVHTKNLVLFLDEFDNTYWKIHLGRDHPKDLKPTYQGDSVGHWEGDVLVVDTVRTNGRQTLLSTARTSSQLHMISRISKSEGGRKLNVQVQIEDPANFTRPFNMGTMISEWTPGFQIYEAHCSQDMRPENTANMIIEEFGND